MEIYSADLHDAEIIIERFGCARFYKEDLAVVLGVSVGTVWTYVAKGKLPRPDYYELMPDNTKRAAWTRSQVAAMLVGRR